eukprot:UN33484
MNLDQNRRKFKSLFESTSGKFKSNFSPGESFDFEISHLFKKNGQFNISLILSCQTSDGFDSRRYVLSYNLNTKMPVMYRISKRTLNELLLLEVVVYNQINHDVTIQNVEIESVPMFIAKKSVSFPRSNIIKTEFISSVSISS